MKKAISALILLLLVGCGGKSFTKNPIDVLVKNMSNLESFSIILYDMEEKGMFFKNYYHQYKVIKEVNGEIKSETTDWLEVSKSYFFSNENNMGMELVSKVKGGKLNKIASPPGYSGYVGNSRYGEWRSSGGNSFWVFYGQYAMLSHLLNMNSYPVYRTGWNDYDRNYRSNRPYYGKTNKDGSRAYGSRSTFAKKTNPNSRWNTKFNKVKRSSSRYNSRSGSRSRSRGFGK
ncbi:MAG: hypothetical protein ACEPO8_15120 [Rhodothermaceae bacterium]